MNISARILRYFKLNPFRSRRRAGFSLIEVALALGITSFASTCIIGMTLMGLSTFRRAMDNTVQSAIVQNLTNEIFLTDFKQLRRMATSQSAVYYFDADGTRLPSQEGMVYWAEISFTDLSSNATSSHPLNLLSPGAGTTALITIMRTDKLKDRFFVMVGNNQQVSTSSTAATW